jgi:hypothetical protein
MKSKRKGIARWEYCPRTRNLHIEGNNGNAYDYLGVPQEAVDTFSSLEDPWTWIKKNIKGKYLLADGNNLVALGLNPKARKTNPRALGTNPKENHDFYPSKPTP